MKLSPKIKYVVLGASLLVIAIVGALWATETWKFSDLTLIPKPEPITYVDRGIDAEHMAKFQERIVAQEALVAEGERDIGEILVLANLYYAVGDIGKAADSYRDILSTNPNDAPAHENLAQVLIEMEDFVGAEAHLRAAANATPYEPTYIKLVDLIDEKFPDRRVEIQTILETAIANLGQTPGLLTRLARWYADRGRIDEAISHYEVAHQLDPEDQTIIDALEELREQRAAQPIN